MSDFKMNDFNKIQKMKNMIRFIGTGNAFSIENNNSFDFRLFTKENSFIRFIYELPMTTCKELIKGVTNGIDVEDDRYIIMISHLHEDHVGGLATYLQYLYFSLGIDIYNKDKLIIICPNKEEMKDYLRLTMGGNKLNRLNIVDNLVDIEGLRNFKEVRILPVLVNHVEGITSCGFITKIYITDIDNVSFYYTGDCNDIPEEIRMLFNEGKIGFMISELSDKPNSVHLDMSYFDKYFDVCDIENGRIIFTHLND